MTNLEDVLKDFDRRLSAIEAQLRQSSHPEIRQTPPKPISNKPEQTTTSPEDFFERPVSSPFISGPGKIQSPRPSTFDSSSMLAFIGIFFVVLAGVFFIKITIDSGWLTPLRQILLAAGAGLSFFIIPQLFPKAEREYGAILAGAGTTILHLTWLGAYFYHHLLSTNAALVCATLVGVFSLATNFEKGNRLFVLVAMAGTYMSAPLVGYNTSELSVLSIFLIIWNITFSAAALINKRRDILFIASYYAVFTVLLLSGKVSNRDMEMDLLVLQLIQFGIFSSLMVSYSIYHRSPLSREESVAVLPLLLLFYFSTGHLISSIKPDYAPWFGLTLGAVIMAIYFLAKTFLHGDLKSGPTLTTFATLTFVHSFYFQLLHESVKPLAGLVIGIIIFVLWTKNSDLRKAYYWPFIILLSTFVYGALLALVSVPSIDGIYFYNWAYGALALVAVIGSGKLQKAKGETTQLPALLLGFGHLQVMLGLYRFSEQISWSGALFVTLTWGIYAGLILAVAYWRRDKTLGNSALTILLAVSLKAFFYDLSNTNNLIRVACLLAEGLLLYFCGWIFKRMQKWELEN